MPVCHVSVCEPCVCGLPVVVESGMCCVWVEERFSPSSSVGQEELAMLRRQLEGKDGEMRRLQDDTSFKAIASSSTDPSEKGVKAGQVADVQHAGTFMKYE